MTIELDKLKNLSHKDADYIRESKQKIKEATSTGNQEEVSRWSIHLELHRKANEANLIKLAACKAERSEISKKLDAPTLHYPTFRLFLESQDLLDAENLQETKEHVEYECDNPTSGRSVSPVPDPNWPPLAEIFSGIRRVPPVYEDYNAPFIITGPSTVEVMTMKDLMDFNRYQQSSLDVPSAASLPPAPQATAPGPSRYDAYAQPIIPRQINLAGSLEAIATDFLPEDVRRHMGDLTPTDNGLQAHLDAPYQDFVLPKDFAQDAVRDFRISPPQQPTREELWRMNTPRHIWNEHPDPPAHYMRPIWDNPLMYGPAPHYPSEPPMGHPRPWIPGHSNCPTPRPAPVKPQPIPWTCHYRHEHISCDGCKRGVKGMRFKCKVSPHLRQCPRQS